MIKLRVSPSQLKMYKECSQAWKYAYKDSLQKIGVKRKYMDLGTYIHELMHVYYQLLQMGNKPGDDFLEHAMRSRIDSDMNNVTADNIEIMAAAWPLILKFIGFQSPRIDQGIQVIAVEHEFSVEIENVVLHGFIDLLYRNSRGQLRIRDHKTSERINAWNQQKLMMDGQQFLYALAMSIEYNEPVYGVEVNFACSHIYKDKVPPSDQLFKLIPYEHNQASLDAFRDHVNVLGKRMVESEPERVYNDRCSSCQFLQLCNLETRGQDISRVIEANYITRESHGTPESELEPKLSESAPEDSEARSETAFKLSFNVPRRDGTNPSSFKPFTELPPNLGFNRKR